MDEEKPKTITIGRIIFAIISLIGVSGVIAILEYQQEQQDREEARYQQALQNYYQRLEEWDKFSPPSLSGSPQTATIRSIDRFDLESGHVSGVPTSDRQWDLLFGCGPQGEEYLRALDGVSWHEVGVADFGEIKYRDIRDADYIVRENLQTGYNDIFFMHRSNVPTNGFTYFIKTPEGNVAKFQIVDYNFLESNPMACRDMNIRYEVFPIKQDPPKPTRPSR